MGRTDGSLLEEYLVEASSHLQADRDITQTIEQITQLLVPRLADWCAVWSISPGGAWHPVAWTHQDMDRVSQVQTFAEYEAFVDEDGFTREAVRSQQPVVFREIEDHLLTERFKGSERFFSLLRPLEARSLIAAPLLARQQVVGVMILVSTRPDQRYDDDDLHTIGQLSIPYGLALDNAQLLESMQVSEQAFDEVSAPVLQIREHLLLLPVIGEVDERRLMRLSDVMLASIKRRRAKVVVVDITAATCDMAMAGRLMQVAIAARLLGAVVIVTGTTPEVAKAFVSVGLDLSQVVTAGDLQDGIEIATRMLSSSLGQPASPAREDRAAPYQE